MGTDLFHWNQAEHLIIADYYSKFPFVRRLSGTATSERITALTKEIFAEQGIPETIISDNGPQFSSHTYQQFTQDWDICHITSSPRYPKFNGFVERTIQTVKHILEKSRVSGEDPYLSLLSLRTTPIDNSIPSPAEILLGRKSRCTLPTRTTVSAAQQNLQQKLIDRQSVQKSLYDRGTTELPKLFLGQSVRMQHQSGEWLPAQVTKVCDQPRSYVVESNGGQYRRNRQQLMDIPQKPQCFDKPILTPTRNLPPSPPATVSNSTCTKYVPRDQSSPFDEQYTASQSSVPSRNLSSSQYTKSGRSVKIPKRLDL